MQCEECQLPLWKAGEVAPAGTYARVDDQSHQMVLLDQEGPLPATFDGHVALYRAAARICACMERANHKPATFETHPVRLNSPHVAEESADPS